MKSIHTAVAALCVASVYASPCNVTNNHPTVRIDAGLVAGTSAAFSSTNVVVSKFLGIPYAERPVRFQPPMPKRPWESIYDATDYKPSCFQSFRGSEAEKKQKIKQFNTPPPPAGESEDCLNLNVYAPAGAAKGSKPVMFWIHGGSLEFGSGSLPLYDGSKFAALEDVVVVTINYRTNLFGFPGHAGLAKGKRNLGLLDQRLALDWVRRNIHAFGGDPDAITIFGESAGGGSVDALIGAPPQPLPFRGAIMQSNQASVNLAGWNGSVDAWAELVKAAGCDCDDINELDCMRAMPAAELRDLGEKTKGRFEAEHDGGVTWADHPREDRLASGEDLERIAKVPVMIGTNADEGRFEILKHLDFRAALSLLVGQADVELPEEAIDALVGIYPIGSPGIKDNMDQLSLFLTDVGVHCPAAIFAADSASVGIKTWRYFYDASFPNSEIFPGSGAYHSAEIELVFGTYKSEKSTEWQEKTSRAMMKAWADFAKDPSKGPGWEGVPKIGAFGGGIRAGDDEPKGAVFEIKESDVLDARCKLLVKLLLGAAQ